MAYFLTFILIFVTYIVVYRLRKRSILNNNPPNESYKTEYLKDLKNQRAFLYDNSISLSDKFSRIKETYPFDKWRKNFTEYEMEQYTEEVCRNAENIFEELTNHLIKLDLQVRDEKKLAPFEKAVLALNRLNNENDDCVIETGEREDLCEIIDRFGIAVGLDPEKYGGGDGIASEWRDW